jgi:hypothetical protein
VGADAVEDVGERTGWKDCKPERNQETDNVNHEEFEEAIRDGSWCSSRRRRAAVPLRSPRIRPPPTTGERDER